MDSHYIYDSMNSVIVNRLIHDILMGAYCMCMYS